MGEDETARGSQVLVHVPMYRFHFGYFFLTHGHMSAHSQLPQMAAQVSKQNPLNQTDQGAGIRRLRLSSSREVLAKATNPKICGFLGGTEPKGSQNKPIPPGVWFPLGFPPKPSGKKILGIWECIFIGYSCVTCHRLAESSPKPTRLSTCWVV